MEAAPAGPRCYLACTIREPERRPAFAAAPAGSGAGLRHHRQPFPTEALGKGLCVFPLRKAEHHEVGVAAAQRLPERRRR
jgi:hypothetical protein